MDITKLVDYLLPKFCLLTFIGIIVCFAVSIQKTGGGLYRQIQNIRNEMPDHKTDIKILKEEIDQCKKGISVLDNALSSHVHKGNQQNKAIFPIRTEINDDGESVYYY